MLGKAIRYALFYYRHRATIDMIKAKHADNLRAFADDAKPLIQAFIAEEMPGSDEVKQAVAVADKVSRDLASPMPGDEWSPTNPNPNAG